MAVRGIGHRWRVDMATAAAGVDYTIVSDYLATARPARAYSDLMPALPWADARRKQNPGPKQQRRTIGLMQREIPASQPRPSCGHRI
jgi:hypothetical protein